MCLKFTLAADTVVVEGSLTTSTDVTSLSPKFLAKAAITPDLVSADMRPAIVPALSGDAEYTTYSTSSADVANRRRLREIWRHVKEFTRTWFTHTSADAAIVLRKASSAAGFHS